jgi:hypothetical protein
LAGLQGKTAFASFLVQNDVDCPFDKVEQFIAVRMHLPSMRRVLAHSGLSRQSALNTRVGATALNDGLDRSSGREMNRALRQIDRILEWLRCPLGLHEIKNTTNRFRGSGATFSRASGLLCA